MGSGLNSKQIDASVGGIVWIRRRNGSWWPGRIMGLNELTEKCLSSSRSGTPVKLLGREDASLDWYNIGKSKRVKAFRCGKFRKCIEKAKVSATQANKKVVKFARREDAILHALELESAYESNKGHVHHLIADGSGKEHEHMDEGGHKLGVISIQELSQSGTSFEDPDSTNITKLHSSLKTRRKPTNDSEDDGSEGAKRMRGLEDLVMGIEPKRRTILHVLANGSHELVQRDSASVSMPNIRLSDGSPLNSSKGSCPSLKGRHIQVTSCTNLKRKNRRRPLAKVLGSTALVSVPVRGTERNDTTLDSSVYRNDAGFSSMHCYPEPNENGFSGLSNIPENDYSDSLFEVPLVGEEPHSGSPIHLSCASRELQYAAVGRQSSQSSSDGSISLSSEELDKSGSVIADVQLDKKPNQSNEKSISRWQWKGYKSSRSLCRKTSKNLDSRRTIARGCGSDDFLWGTDHMYGLSAGFSLEHDMNTFDESLVSDNAGHCSNQNGEPNYSDTIKYGRQQVLVRSAERSSSQFYSCEDSTIAMTKPQMGDTDLYLTRSLPLSPLMPQRSHYRQSHFTSIYDDIAGLSSRNMPEGSSLFDVNLEVGTSYKGQHLPLVSLTSNLSGKAIIGHSLQVEVCDSTYSNLLISSIDSSPTSCDDKPYKRLEPPNCSTAKHNNVKSSSSPKRSMKNKRMFMSKKTRKLSSFEMECRKPVMEKLTGPVVVACVPLKVVFSRINEGLNSSGRSTRTPATI